MTTATTALANLANRHARSARPRRAHPDVRPSLKSDLQSENGNHYTQCGDQKVQWLHAARRTF